MKKSIKDLENIQGKRALVRVDVNVPLDENKNVTDDTRIKAILPTIKMLKDKGAKIILMAHLGRPKGEWKEEFSLAPVAKYMSKVLGEDVLFVSKPVGKGAEEELKDLKDGQVALLENIRFYKEEEAKDDDMTFANELAKLGDFYVNDAFGAAHRKHTSTAKLAHVLKPAVAGLLMEKELNALGGLLNNPQRPFTAVVGGAKISSKIGVLENLLDKVDNLIVGGGMAYTFVKANGGKIGNSIHEDDQMEVAKAIEKKAKDKGVNLIMATDVLVTDDFSGNGTNKVVDVYNIPDGFEGVDAGPNTQKAFEEVIKKSKTILMNGPVGAFENPKFAQGTKAVLNAIVEATKAGAVSVVGGGDSVSAAKKFCNGDDFTHISTGGGASLEFIEGKVLPGVDALDD
ncbi:TPA: phosphoglycerate kinase [Candidatus Galligastranaerophilus intestinavium]|uniref:Phosphoglycerate kinase n=1 Tax=Candidatus Galligastranaerophilus intestinavium TaxID=2840836 RepID=A0A9D1JY09_9BACT|nr:phosphoglycerate kinase [Candidatus Galligastranaerophilus intestinavium]